MKLSKQTVNVMKNFASINRAIKIKPGNHILTVSAGRSVFSMYEAPETFPVNIPIYDLSELNSAIGLFDDPEVTFETNKVVLSSGDQKLEYSYSEDSLIPEPPALDVLEKYSPKLTGVSFSADTFSQISKASSVLRVNDLMLIAKDGKLVMEVTNSKLPSSNNFKIFLQDVDEKLDFNLCVLVENLKMLPFSYTLNIYEKFILFEYVGSNEKLVYVITLEANSKW